MASHSQIDGNQPTSNSGADGQSSEGSSAIGQGLIDELHNEMMVLEEQIAAGEGDVAAAEVKLAALEEGLAMSLNGIEPGAGSEASNNTDICDVEAVEQVSVLGELNQVIEAPLAIEELEELFDENAEIEVANADNIAEDLAGIEPAAGDGASGGSASNGYGFQSSFEATPVGALDDVGPIDPTQLKYGVNFNNEDLQPQERSPIGEDDNPLIIKPDAHNLDETNLNLSQDGKLEVDFGNDGAGSITTTDNFTASGSLSGGEFTSGGLPVTVTATPGGYEGVAGGNVVFTLNIDPNTGEYAYNQVLPFDHNDGTDPNDVITLEFGVQVSDSDGDTAATTITINVADDAPLGLDPEVAIVDESNMAPNVAINGTLEGDFGNDGAGTISGSGNSIIGDLTSNGEPVTVTFDATSNSYIGVSSIGTVFTLKIQDNGDYEFILLDTLDHPDTADHNDVLDLQFGVNITDSDGDSVEGLLTIQVADDGPVANDDTNQVDAAGDTAEGNVITGENGGPGAVDDLSQDNANTVTKVSFGGASIDVPETGTTSINGDFGTLEIASDGSYTYTLNPGAGAGSAGSEISLDPSQGDVAGTQETLTKDGITISVANDGDYDLSWVDTPDGSGIGIDNLNAGDSPKVWPKGETFDIALDNPADTVTITIAEIGDNNDDGNHGVDYTITLADGSTVTGEAQFDPAEIVDGTITFTLNSDSYGGQDISSIALNSTNAGDYQGASFLLNNVQATYPGDSVEICDQFEYTLTDGDGDTSTAILKLEGVEPTLIVGENVDDVAGSTTPHHIGGDEAAITGTDAGDVLVGDVGGSNLEQTCEDFNFLFVLDVSGSMGDPCIADSKISLLVDAVENLLGDMGQYQNGDVKIHFTPFSTVSDGGATFTITDGAGLSGAINYLNALSTGGWTNYESALQNGIDWLQSGDAIDGAQTVTYFISDGEPNRYLDNNGDVVENTDANVAMDQIDGTSDSSNEIALLNSLSSDVIGVGIDIGDAIVRLNAIDSDGNAMNIDDPTDLGSALASTNPLLRLASLGDDTIEGGGGDHIIFGDSLNTDALADDHVRDMLKDMVVHINEEHEHD